MIRRRLDYHLLMFQTRPTRKHATRGNALPPLLIIIGALTVSGLVFYFYTRNHIESQRGENSPAAQANTPDNTSAPQEIPRAPTERVFGSKPNQGPATSIFEKPADLGEQFSRMLASGDLANAAKILSPDDSAQAVVIISVLEKIIQGLGYKPDVTEKVEVIGQIGNLIRISVPLQSPTPGAPPVRIALDLARDSKMGWKVSQLHLPKELESALAAMPAENKNATATATPFFVLDRTPDALSYANDFVHALIKPDYATALKLVNSEKVLPVKLAALCIVFEDGKYELAHDKPLASTIATETTAWVIARVHSETLKEETEFGLEMENTGGQWRVSGLNLSKLLGDNAKDSFLAGVPYTPLVKNPKGGESIALFYEYDHAQLHPRAQKQLDIIADILKASPAKKLRIGGYTDAKGTDDYNIDLSKKRAESVKQYFLTHGVPIAQVETTGFGKQLPLSPNEKADGSDNPEGRSRNRRAEILLDF